MKNTKKRIYILTFAAAFAAGCGATTKHQEAGSLSRDWERQFREYQIYPIFPPRETVQVGNVYLACKTDSPAKSFRSLTHLVTRLPGTKEALMAHENSRLEFVKTAVNPETTIGAIVNTTPATAHTAASNPAKPKQIEHQHYPVSFPDFFRATITGGNLGALVPAETFLVGLGIGMEDISSISVSVPAGVSYELPLSAMPPLIETTIKDGKFADKKLGDLVKEMAKSDPACLNGYHLVVVTEVFKAHALDVVMNFKTTAAAKMSADFLLAPDSQKKKLFDALATKIGQNDAAPSATQSTPPVNATTSPPPAAQVATPPASSSAAAASNPGQAPASKPTAAERSAALIADVRVLLAEIEKSTQRQFPGVTAKLYSGGSSGITLTKSYSEPIPIGYKAIFLAEDESGEFKPKGPPEGGTVLGGQGKIPEKLPKE